uniref:Uncharacterized protein n=1 Tax=Rhipicephalus appendiculatus TaxID=34631 RepID=A0A131YBQ8_RHIAP
MNNGIKPAALLVLLWLNFESRTIYAQLKSGIKPGAVQVVLWGLSTFLCACILISRLLCCVVDKNLKNCLIKISFIWPCPNSRKSCFARPSSTI